MRVPHTHTHARTHGQLVCYLRRTPPACFNRQYLHAKRAALDEELQVPARAAAAAAPPRLAHGPGARWQHWERHLAANAAGAGAEGSLHLVGAGLTLADVCFFPALAYLVRLGLELDRCVWA